MRGSAFVGSVFVVAALALLVAPQSSVSQTLASSDQCRSCHLDLEDERLSQPAANYERDVHAIAGFGCLACHGGAGGLDPSAGFLATPDRRNIPEMCGECHSDPVFMRSFDPQLRVDQVQEYWTSEHGRLLLETGDPDVATCNDCHPAHEMLPASDPESTVHPMNIPETCSTCHSDPRLMALRGLPTDQHQQWASSVHGAMMLEEGDLSSPVCNDCHGNHGAAPPGFASVRTVCGQCHSVMADYFAESAHAEIFEEEGVPGCSLCHQHHAVEPVSDALLIDRSADVCSDCHEADDPNGAQFLEISSVLDSLDLVVEASRHVLEEAESRGMEVAQALFELEDVNNARTRARSAVHTFQAGPVREEVAEGFEIADAAAEQGEEALGEYQFRRLGLGVSALVILLLITALFLKIHDMDERLEELVAAFEGYYARVFADMGASEANAQQMRIAACALLLEATHADGRFTDDEREHIEGLVRVRFELAPAEAEELLALAERARDTPESVGRLTEMIAKNFSPRQKRNLINELWTLVYADGELTSHEERFVKHVSKLLGVEEMEVFAAARPARANGDIDERSGDAE